MIYRRWSLLTGPPTIAAGVVGVVVLGELLFGKTGESLGLRARKEEPVSIKK